jgi:hypothetical protein
MLCSAIIGLAAARKNKKEESNGTKKYYDNEHLLSWMWGNFKA